jgi:peroxiredoxin
MHPQLRRLTILVSLAAAVSFLTLSNSSVEAENVTKAKVGQPAPDFELYDLQGELHTLSQYTKQGKIVVLEWFNPDCPYVKKHHLHNKTMNDLQSQYSGKDVVWLAINSGAKGKQGAQTKRNLQAVEEYDINYPILMDNTSDVGRLYGAKTTPGMYVIDAQGILRYAGAIDNNSSARKLGTVNYVAQALDAVLDNSQVPTPETKSYGCSVKY